MDEPKTYLVKKDDTATISNILNEMFFDRTITLQELRFFMLYASKINPKDPSNTKVSYTLEEYAEILGVELNESDIEKTIHRLLTRIVYLRPKVLDDDILEEVIITQLFSRCRITRRKTDNKWYFEFDASEDLKPHIFDLTEKFTSIEIWNVINLSNFQDARMYMLLRQYKTAGQRTIRLKDLKQMLNIDVQAYPQYPIFARDVLKKCQKALKQRTDIKFEFNAVGRPAHSVHFKIESNDAYTLPAFLEEQKVTAAAQLPAPALEPEQMTLADYQEQKAAEYSTEALGFLAGACNYEFTEKQLQRLVDLMLKMQIMDSLKQFDYLVEKYHILEAAAEKRGVANRYGYIKKLIAIDAE